jgi:hypothetical protein
MQYRPLKFFWIAEFSDGTAVAQFDPDSGKEVMAHPDWLPSKTKNGFIVKDGKEIQYREAYPVPAHFKGKQVVKIGWYPFTEVLAEKIFEATGKLVIPSSLKPFTVKVGCREKPVCYRSHAVKIDMRKGGVEYSKVVYVLGVEDRKLSKMSEDGEVSW